MSHQSARCELTNVKKLLKPDGRFAIKSDCDNVNLALKHIF